VQNHGRRHLVSEASSSARGQAANYRSYLGVIGPRETHVSTNEANEEGSFK